MISRFSVSCPSARHRSIERAFSYETTCFTVWMGSVTCLLHMGFDFVAFVHSQLTRHDVTNVKGMWTRGQRHTLSGVGSASGLMVSPSNVNLNASGISSSFTLVVRRVASTRFLGLTSVHIQLFLRSPLSIHHVWHSRIEGTYREDVQDFPHRRRWFHSELDSCGFLTRERALARADGQ